MIWPERTLTLSISRYAQCASRDADVPPATAEAATPDRRETIQILGVLTQILGGFASGYGGGGYSAPSYSSSPAGVSRTYGQGSPSGSGYVYRNNGGSNSTITGGR